MRFSFTIRAPTTGFGLVEPYPLTASAKAVCMYFSCLVRGTRSVCTAFLLLSPNFLPSASVAKGEPRFFNACASPFSKTEDTRCARSATHPGANLRGQNPRGQNPKGKTERSGVAGCGTLCGWLGCGEVGKGVRQRPPASTSGPPASTSVFSYRLLPSVHALGPGILRPRILGF